MLNVDAERRWISDVRHSGEPASLVQRFAAHYHYFSLNQIHAFSSFLRIIPVTDAASLAEVAKVVYEELGEGRADRVHSVLFRRFAEFVGVPPERLPLPRNEVLPAMLGYLAELDSVFTGSSIERAAAGYLFLEESAVRAYEPLLALFEEIGLDKAALEFFEIHTRIEIGHAGVAKALAERYNVASTADFIQQYLKLETLWDSFWDELCRESRAASL